MTLKIFCNSCHEFVRDAKSEEISSLRGTEICQGCESKHSEFLAKIDKMANRATNKINDVLNRFQADCEEAKRHIVKAEPKPELEEKK